MACSSGAIGAPRSSPIASTPIARDSERNSSMPGSGRQGDVVELGRVVLQELALPLGADALQRLCDTFEWVGVQAGRVGIVGFEHDVVDTDAVDHKWNRRSFEP